MKWILKQADEFSFQLFARHFLKEKSYFLLLS